MAKQFREGIYRAEFNTLTMEGIGLVVLRDGRVYGGDTLIYYVGTYSVSGNRVTARVKAFPYKGMPIEGVEPVFGRGKNALDMEGEIDGDDIVLGGRSKEASGTDIKIKLRFLHD